MLYQQPQLDIISYFPNLTTLSDIDHASTSVLATGMALPPDQALYVATYTVDADALRRRGHSVQADVPAGRILRSVLMKPEVEDHLPGLHDRLLSLIRRTA